MKIDQHMMYIINGYYGPGLHRLRSISGPHGFEIEQGIKSKGFGPRSRGYFLNLTKESIMKISRLLSNQESEISYMVNYWFEYIAG